MPADQTKPSAQRADLPTAQGRAAFRVLDTALAAHRAGFPSAAAAEECRADLALGSRALRLAATEALRAASIAANGAANDLERAVGDQGREWAAHAGEMAAWAAKASRLLARAAKVSAAEGWA